MIQAVKNTIPVYDIGATASSGDLMRDLIIAESFAHYLAGHPHFTNPHRHSFHHMVLFTEGRGSHTVDFEEFEVKRGQVYFMIPGQVHSWSFEGNPDGYILNFSDQIFRNTSAAHNYPTQFSFFSGRASEGVINLSAIAFKTAVDYLQQILAEVKYNKQYSVEMISALLQCLFITIARENQTVNSIKIAPHNQLTLQNFKKLVEQYYNEKRLPKDYASMLYITPNHLNALCNDILGKPAGEIIRDRILLEAKRLLINADIAISAIAAGLSFTDNSHFTRFFKKYTGTTPDEFRKTTTNQKSTTHVCS